MRSDLFKKPPEETPEVAYADKWLQRLLTYIPLPAGVFSLILNQTTLAIVCLLWLAAAIGYSFIKYLRKDKSIILELGAFDGNFPPLTSGAEKPLEKEVTSKKGITPKEEKPKTLVDFFNTDFQGDEKNVLVADLPIPIEYPESPKDNLTIQLKIVNDFTVKSKFVGFYVPTSDKTFSHCVNLANNYKKFLSFLDERITLEGGLAYERPTNSRELKFTGRIFIYHETYLLAEQKNSLEKLFKRNRVSLMLRSVDYVINRNATSNANNTKPQIIEVKGIKPRS